jgi:pyridoxamine 5'-phosphate oxidase
MKLEEIRREYISNGLHREQLESEPMVQFQKWLQQTIEAQIKDPTAMVVATVDQDLQPSQRIVLLKDVDDASFSFYTNLGSKKAQDLSLNNKVSLLFPWHAMERQVKVSGTAERIPTARVLKYFLSRPKDSQIAAVASQQSRPIDSRQMLLNQFSKLKQKFADGEVPLPDFWGGFKVIPHKIEFWQGSESRLHDRFVYTKSNDGWQIERLMP